MTDDELAIKRERARQARELFAHPLMQEAYEVLQLERVNRWLATKEDESAKRERLWSEAKASLAFHEWLLRIVNDSLVADHEHEKAQQS